VAATGNRQHLARVDQVRVADLGPVGLVQHGPVLALAVVMQRDPVQRVAMLHGIGACGDCGRLHDDGGLHDGVKVSRDRVRARLTQRLVHQRCRHERGSDRHGTGSHDDRRCRPCPLRCLLYYGGPPVPPLAALPLARLGS
jgi:hypothetical protein